MKCPDCKSEVFGPVCTNCGFVIEDRPIEFHPDTDEINKDPEEKVFINGQIV